MTPEEKLAVLKMAGYEICSTKNRNDDFPWDWFHHIEDFEADSYFQTQTDAIDDAFEHLQQTHQNNA